MKVLLDGKEISTSIAVEGTLKDAMLFMQTNLCPPDHMVIGIRCNGREIPGDEMESCLSQSISTYEKLEITTCTRENLITDTMTQASVSLEETETACRRVAELFTEGNNVEAIETLGGCLKIWQQVHEAVGKSLIILGVDPEKIMIQDESIDRVISKPKEVLMQIKQALQTQDYVLLSDILQYEFLNVIDLWHSVIARLQQEAEELETRELETRNGKRGNDFVLSGR